jgi:hypothetical protein
LLDEQLKRIPPAVRPTVKAAIRTVREIAPKADEMTYQSRPPRSASSMWKIVRYSVDGANVVGIGTFAKHSAMFFYRGRELDAGAGVLEGSGEDTRFIRLKSAADVQSPAVRRLVRKAFKLGGSDKE